MRKWFAPWLAAVSAGASVPKPARTPDALSGRFVAAWNAPSRSVRLAIAR